MSNKMKDHEKRELVSRLTALAREFGETQQLRERIAGEVLPALDAAVAAERERWQRAATMAVQELAHCAPYTTAGIACAELRALLRA